MSADIIRLLPAQEHALLECYVTGATPPASFQQLYDELRVPTNAEPTRLQIAVAQILLHDRQDDLPQWVSIRDDKVLINRERHERHPNARLRFNPQLLFGINWATSGPGFEWPEEYHVTLMPGFDKLVFTASRDGPDAWGCEDHAIGVADNESLPQSARKVLTEYWLAQADGWDQQRWESCTREGLVDDAVANAWAEDVWPRTPRQQPRRRPQGGRVKKRKDAS
jgi:hypothetical protein